MFRAALVSRSCTTAHEEHVHSLIRSPALPFGLHADLMPPHEHVLGLKRFVNFFEHHALPDDFLLALCPQRRPCDVVQDVAILVFAIAFTFTMPSAADCFLGSPVKD